MADDQGVFISYSRRDSAFVRGLVARLEAAGRSAWVDWEDIPLSSEWLREIEAAIEAANTILVVVSPDWAASRICRYESEYAARFGKRIFPVVSRDVAAEELPAEVRARNWLQFRADDDHDAAFGLLTDALDANLEWARVHALLTVRAVAWQREGEHASALPRGRDLRDAEVWLESAQELAWEPKSTELLETWVLLGRTFERGRRRRAGVAGLASLVLLGGLGVWGWRATDQATVEAARRLEAEAEAEQAQLERTEAQEGEAAAERRAQSEAQARRQASHRRELDVVVEGLLRREVPHDDVARLAGLARRTEPEARETADLAGTLLPWWLDGLPPFETPAGAARVVVWRGSTFLRSDTAGLCRLDDVVGTVTAHEMGDDVVWLHDDASGIHLVVDAAACAVRGAFSTPGWTREWTGTSARYGPSLSSMRVARMGGGMADWADGELLVNAHSGRAALVRAVHGGEAMVWDDGCVSPVGLRLEDLVGPVPSVARGRVTGRSCHDFVEPLAVHAVQFPPPLGRREMDRVRDGRPGPFVEPGLDGLPLLEVSVQRRLARRVGSRGSSCAGLGNDDRSPYALSVGHVSTSAGDVLIAIHSPSARNTRTSVCRVSPDGTPTVHDFWSTHGDASVVDDLALVDTKSEGRGMLYVTETVDLRAMERVPFVDDTALGGVGRAGRIALSPGRTRLAAVVRPGGVRVWTRTDKGWSSSHRYRSLNTQYGAPLAVSFFGSNRLVVATDGPTLLVLSVDEDALSVQSVLEVPPFPGGARSEDADVAVSATSRRTVVRWGDWVRRFHVLDDGRHVPLGGPAHVSLHPAERRHALRLSLDEEGDVALVGDRGRFVWRAPRGDLSSEEAVVRRTGRRPGGALVDTLPGLPLSVAVSEARPEPLTPIPSPAGGR